MEFEVGSGGSSVPPGTYKAAFASVEATEPHPEFGPGVRFGFMVRGGDHDGEEATTICGTKKLASPKNRLGRVLAGITGSPVQPGVKVVVEPFIGKLYLIQVELAPGGNGSRVTTIIPTFLTDL